MPPRALARLARQAICHWPRLRPWLVCRSRRCGSPSSAANSVSCGMTRVPRSTPRRFSHRRALPVSSSEPTTETDERQSPRNSEALHRPPHKLSRKTLKERLQPYRAPALRTMPRRAPDHWLRKCARMSALRGDAYHQYLAAWHRRRHQAWWRIACEHRPEPRFSSGYLRRVRSEECWTERLAGMGR